MSLSRVKTWISEVLTASDLNAEFSNILTYLNGSATAAFVSPAITGTVTGGATYGIGDGTVGTPGLNFTSDTDNGAYRIGANNWALSAAGAKTLELSSGAAAVWSLLGIGMAPVNVLDITKNTSGTATASLLNTTSGTTANAEFRVGAGSTVLELLALSQGYTTAGPLLQGGSLLAHAGAGGLTLLTQAGSGNIYFAPNGSEGARFNTSGELTIGYGATDNGAYLLQVNSQIFATNATVATSDATVKSELPPPTSDMFDRIAAIPTRMYDRIDRPQDGSRAGYFAQDWEAIFGLGGMVKRPPAGKLTLDEGSAHSLKIAAMERRIGQLEAKLTGAGIA